MFKKISFLIAFFPALIYGGQDGEISATGSTTLLPVIQKAAEIFESSSAKTKIYLRGGGSSVGIASMIDSTTDIAMTSRAFKKEEMEAALKNGITPVPEVVALDAIVIVVHPSNPVVSLTRKQVKDIFSGMIKNWSQVGGENDKIILISRDSPSGTFETFNSRVMENERIAPDALMLLSNQNVVNTTSSCPSTIGYISFGYLVPGVKPMDIGGVSPSRENIRSGRYSLARKLYIYTRGAPEKTVKRFMDFLTGKDGQEIVEELGFISAR